jgi:hypothetical protein
MPANDDKHAEEEATGSTNATAEELNDKNPRDSIISTKSMNSVDPGNVNNEAVTKVDKPDDEVCYILLIISKSPPFLE